MKLKKTMIFILILAVIILLLLGVHWLNGRHSKTLIQSFFNDAVNSSDLIYEHYIHPNFEGNLSLIEFLSSSSEDIDYRVLNSRRANLREYKITVELAYRGNSIPIKFMVLRDNGHWLISHMPDYLYIPGALFIGHGESSDVENLIFDIRGTTQLYSSAYPLSANNYTPISLHIVDNFILKYDILNRLSLTRVMRYDQQQIEDIHLGHIDKRVDLPIYINQVNDIVYSKDNLLPIGAENVQIYYDSDNIAQMAIYEAHLLDRSRVRVLIGNSSHQSKVHEDITMDLRGSYIIKCLDRDQPLEFTFEEGDNLEFQPSQEGIQLTVNGQFLGSAIDRWHIANLDSKIVNISNLERGFTKGLDTGTPYRGDFEVAQNDEGLILINEIDIEEYLPSVVTSEMPVSFGLEALKVQAICARAYAMASLDRTGFATYGAHLDDSTASQVYNNTIEHPSALNAVLDTRGIVPLYQEEIVDTRFFSTSSGYTASSSQVWSDSDATFPSREIPYLLARPQFAGDSPGLHNDENLRAFIDNVNNSSYDRFSAFFRWSVTFTREELEASIEENLSKLWSQQPSFVLTRVGDTYQADIPIPEDLGSLLNIGVISRGDGGNIMELELSTTSGNYKVIKELNIRSVLRPINYIGDQPIELKCHDGSVREDFPLLPSTFAYIDILRNSDGDISHVTINGGGYGHGVGMSQYGTYGLTLLGKTYREILEHFYPGCELKEIY